MIPISEILFMPGAFIGLWFLIITCKLGINLESMCTLDHGSATSTGERVFVEIGNVIFWGIVLVMIAIYIRKKFKNRIVYEK